MKRHQKTKRMSRIRVVSFKRKINAINRKKKPDSPASIQWKKSVTNCTIPPTDLSKPHFKEVDAYGHKIIINTEIQDNSNGKAWPKGGESYYVSIRDKHKKEIYENTARRQHNEKGELLCSWEGGSYRYKGKRKPWYMLDTRKTYHYEEHKKSWGNHTDYLRVPSEAAEMYNRTIPKKMGRCAYMEALVQHKLNKWIKKNPCPIKENCEQKDLFESQYLPEWKEKRDIALERFRDFVVSVYDKLQLFGRFEIKNNGQTDYESEKVAEVKDINCEGHNVNSLNPKKSKLLKKVQKITDKVHEKRTNLICTNLKDHKKQKGRLILPKAA